MNFYFVCWIENKRICLFSAEYRPWQTRSHCCGHIVAVTNVFLFARARNICCWHKFCVRDTNNVFYFVQKHFVPATNVSQFAQPIAGSCYKKNENTCKRMLPKGWFRYNILSLRSIAAKKVSDCDLRDSYYMYVIYRRVKTIFNFWSVVLKVST